MKTYDLATGAIFAGLLALVAQGAHTEATAITECERVDNGGYFTFADANCAATFREDDDAFEVVEAEPAPEPEPETEAPAETGDYH